MIGSVAVSDARVQRTASSYSHWLPLAAVVVAFCLPLFVGLGRTDLQSDEAIYSFAVDVMLHDGDWLTPKSSPHADEAFLEKPPLKFWIVAAPIRLGLLPDNEFGLRFWDAVFGSLAFLYVFAIGRRMGGVGCGLASVLALFTQRLLLFEHWLRSNNMEAALVLAYCGGVYHFLAWEREDRASRASRHVVAVALYFTLAFMTKFVAALFLPGVLALAVVASADARARLRRDARSWLAAAALTAVLILPWFLYQFHRVGNELWRVMFQQHVFTRFTGFLDPEHVHPWHFYLSMLFSELRVAGAVFVTAAGLALVLARVIGRGWRDGFVLLCWAAVPLTLMSFGSSKLYHYTYPFLPPVALAAGYAAAVLGGLAWSLSAPAARLDGPHTRTVHPVVRWPRARVVLLGLALASWAVAVATWAMDHVWLKVGDVVVFRNAGVLRPAVVGAAALALSGRAGTGLRVGAVALLLSALLPLNAYRNEISQLDEGYHRLRLARACLAPICARAGGADPRGPGVWAEGFLTHVHAAYLSALGPYDQRGHTSDPTVFMHLYVPSRWRPVLLGTSRFEEFTHLVAGRDPVLIERAARKAGVDAAALAAQAQAAPIGLRRVPEGGVLLLPGPYAVCATEGTWNPVR